MLSLRSWRKIYSLETLDTRFVVSSNTPPRISASDFELNTVRGAPSTQPNAARERSASSGARTGAPSDIRPPLWETLEFYVYYFIFVTVVPLMFYIPYTISKRTELVIVHEVQNMSTNPKPASHPNYLKYVNLLSDGWVPGRKVVSSTFQTEPCIICCLADELFQDNSDGQYASFRNNIPYLAVVVVLHPLLRTVYDYFWRANTYIQTRQIPSSSKGLTQGLPGSAAASARLQQRVSFDFYFAIIFVIALHGFSALKIVLILFTNYVLAKGLRRQYVPAATWLFNIAILFANELGHGYPYASIATTFSPFQNSRPAAKGFQEWNWGNWLDDYSGLIPRWEVLFNITVLRLISFNLDYYWSLNMQGGSPVEVYPSTMSASPD